MLYAFFALVGLLAYGLIRARLNARKDERSRASRENVHRRLGLDQAAPYHDPRFHRPAKRLRPVPITFSPLPEDRGFASPLPDFGTVHGAPDLSPLADPSPVLVAAPELFQGGESGGAGGGAGWDAPADCGQSDAGSSDCGSGGGDI